VQTLFDADRYEQLAELYTEKAQQDPNDLEAVNILIQVYSRWDKWDEMLKWSIRRAEISSDDAEAAYSVGVLIYNRLFSKGGGADATRYDPRPDVEQSVLPPVFAPDDIVGEARVALADKGISFLEKALARRTDYQNAMVYLNLLLRQRSLAYLDDPEKWQSDIQRAEEWRTKAQKLALSAASEEGQAAASPPPSADDAREAEQ
jgi:hypothetical protein